jgi:hypothetical protein
MTVPLISRRIYHRAALRLRKRTRRYRAHVESHSAYQAPPPILPNGACKACILLNMRVQSTAPHVSQRKLLQTSFRRAAKSVFRLVFRFQSAEVFLNHTQMDPEPVQVDFECACNLERAHG